MVNVGLQLRLEAKPGKEKELEEFLRAQLPYALGEPATVAWFAIKLSANTFGIFDAFENESGRQAHICLLYTSPSPRDQRGSRMPSSA